MRWAHSSCAQGIEVDFGMLIVYDIVLTFRLPAGVAIVRVIVFGSEVYTHVGGQYRKVQSPMW